MPELLQVDLFAAVSLLAVPLHAKAPDVRRGLADPDQVDRVATFGLGTCLVVGADDLLRVGGGRLSFGPVAVMVSS